MTTDKIKVYENYEINPCRRSQEPDSLGKYHFEVCEVGEADVWTLYGHVHGEGVQAIGDFASHEAAEEVFFRITGSCKADACLRVMHAGKALLKAAETARRRAANQERLSVEDCDELSVAIAQATGRAA
jgi:hypothetical protein